MHDDTLKNSIRQGISSFKDKLVQISFCSIFNHLLPLVVEPIDFRFLYKKNSWTILKVDGPQSSTHKNIQTKMMKSAFLGCLRMTVEGRRFWFRSVSTPGCYVMSTIVADLLKAWFGVLIRGGNGAGRGWGGLIPSPPLPETGMGNPRSDFPMWRTFNAKIVSILLMYLAFDMHKPSISLLILSLTITAVNHNIYLIDVEFNNKWITWA